MSSIYATLAVFLPILSQIAPVLFGVAILYLRSQFPHKSDFDRLANQVSDLGAKLSANSASVEHLARDQDSAPNRMELLGRISGLESRVSGMESGIQSIQHQLHTTNDYLKILVDRGLER